MASRLRSFLQWEPLAAGSRAPALSLTADDGTWIKLPDFEGHLEVVLVFLRRTEGSEVEGFLRALDASRARFEALDTALFAVHTSRTDALRAARARLGVSLPFLYDPLALTARGFHASGRIRPWCRDTVVWVRKDGTIGAAWRGFPPLETVIAQVAAAQGKPIPPPPARTAPQEGGVADTPQALVVDIDSAHTMTLLGEEGSRFVLVDVRTRGEFDADHAPMARHIPVDELPHRYAELGQTSHLVFVCHSGGRSAAAGEFMTSIGGTHIYNVAGGMSQWTGPRIVAGTEPTRGQ